MLSSEYQKLHKCVIICLHWRNTCQGPGVEKRRGFGTGVHINHQSLSPTKGETNFLMDLSGNIWNIKKKIKIRISILKLAFILYAYANISEDYLENLLCHCLYENYYRDVVFKTQIKLFILITCFTANVLVLCREHMALFFVELKLISCTC